MFNFQKSKFIAGIGLTFLFILIYVLYILFDAGYFKVIKNQNLQDCQKIAGVHGPEDFAISKNKNVIFISSDERPDGGGLSNKQGKIFRFDPQRMYFNELNLKITFEFHPHGIEVYEDKEETYLFVINHRSEFSTVELFKFNNEELLHVKTFRNELLINPNDIFPTGPDSFYLSHDHGSKSDLMKSIENYLKLGSSFVSFYDGKDLRVVADGLVFANGLALDKLNNKLFVASMLSKKILKYSIQKNNDLKLEKEIKLESAPDNIFLDDYGTLWIGAHSNLIALKNHMLDHSKKSPFEVIKLENDLKSVVISSDGELMSGASGALVFEHLMLVGSIFESKFLVCQI